MNIKDMTEEEIKAYETLHGCKLRREPREAEPAATNPHSLAIAAKVNETAKALMTSPSPEQIRLHADIKVLKRTNQSLLERNDTLDAKVDAAENQRVLLMEENIQLREGVKVLNLTNQSLRVRNDLLENENNDLQNRVADLYAKVDAAENQRVMLMKIIDELKVQSQPSTSSESPASE